jgi:hypothetical protein
MTTLIGARCKDSNILSRGVLIRRFSCEECRNLLVFYNYLSNQSPIFREIRNIERRFGLFFTLHKGSITVKIATDSPALWTIICKIILITLTIAFVALVIIQGILPLVIVFSFEFLGLIDKWLGG